MNKNENIVVEQIKQAFAKNDLKIVEQLVSENESEYDDDLNEIAFRIAVQVGCYSYVYDHYEDVELNDINYGECSSYLHETDDEGIIDFLTSVGAYRSCDEYDGYMFAVETVNGSILSFDTDFQHEVFNKFLEKTKLSEKKVIELLESGKAAEYDLPDEIGCIDVDTLQEACDLLKVSTDGEKILLEEFDYMDDSVHGWTLRELIENLGWHCSFEGDSWKLETTGVYFIK